MSLALQSLKFDVDLLLRSQGVSPATTVPFIVKKYGSLLALAAGRSPRFTVRDAKYTARNISELGTLQSCITDMSSVVIASKILPDQCTVIDVGANVGQFCHALKVFRPAAKVVCLEPDQESFRRLQLNTQDFSDVHLLNVGAGERSESLQFFRHDLSGMSSFVPLAEHDYPESRIETLDVGPLDEYLEPFVELLHGQIDLLKIDVEGFESSVLKGAGNTLRRSRYLLIELSLARDTDGTSNLDVLDLVRVHCPKARIVRLGRALGSTASGDPVCQDALLSLQ